MSNVFPGTMTNGIGFKRIGKDGQVYWSEIINATATIDPPSIAAGAGNVTAAITVTGADVGDRINVFPPYSTQGIMVYGNVSAPDTVILSFFNPTGAAVDLASGTWQIQVVRP